MPSLDCASSISSLNAESYQKYEHLATKIFDGFMRPVYGKGEIPRPCTVFKTNRASEIDLGAGIQTSQSRVTMVELESEYTAVLENLFHSLGPFS